MNSTVTVTRHDLARALGKVGLDLRVPFVVVAPFAGDVRAAVDIPDFNRLVLENRLLPIPRT